MQPDDALEFHPLATIFPALDDAAFEALTEDIRQGRARSPPLGAGSTAMLDSRSKLFTQGEAMSANKNSKPLTTAPTEHDEPPTLDRRPHTLHT